MFFFSFQGASGFLNLGVSVRARVISTEAWQNLDFRKGPPKLESAWGSEVLRYDNDDDDGDNDDCGKCHNHHHHDNLGAVSWP